MFIPIEPACREQEARLQELLLEVQGLRQDVRDRDAELGVLNRKIEALISYALDLGDPNMARVRLNENLRELGF